MESPEDIIDADDGCGVKKKNLKTNDDIIFR